VPPGCIDDVVLDRQVLEEEFSRKIVVRLDAPNLGRGEEDVFGPDTGEEVFDGP